MFARGKFRQIAHHCGQPIVAQPRNTLPTGDFRAQAQYGVPIFGIVVGDALDGTGETVHKDKYTRRIHEFAIFSVVSWYRKICPARNLVRELAL